MSAQRFDLRAIAPQPWKNGAGLTREIAYGGPSPANFEWRISIAEVARDAPFSAYAGIDRCIVLLGGEGMHLRSPDGTIDHALTDPLVPFRFSGDAALDATLIGGATSDFNVMTRRGVFASEVGVHRTAGVLPCGDTTLLLCIAGLWSVGPGTALRLAPMQGLLWRQSEGSISVDPLDASSVLLAVRLHRERAA